MKFVVATAFSDPTHYCALARAAEGAGFDALAVSDHVVHPEKIASRYPYSESGEWAARTMGECLDQLATLAFLAGRTERLRLLTSVMVVPHRQPVLRRQLQLINETVDRGLADRLDRVSMAVGTDGGRATVNTLPK